MSESESVNPYDNNTVVLNYDGLTLKSKDSLQIGASYCCENEIEVWLELFQDDLRVNY